MKLKKPEVVPLSFPFASSTNWLAFCSLSPILRLRLSENISHYRLSGFSLNNS